MRRWISYFASLALILTIAVPAALAQQKKGQAKGQGKAETKVDIRVRGKITKVEGTDRIVVRTQDNKDVILVANPQTRFTINGKAGRFADLRVGNEIDVAYLVQDNVNVVNTVLVGDLEPADATFVEGTVVRVVGEDQIVVRDRADKEVIVFVNPQTRFLIDERPVRLVDFRQGANVRINVDTRDNRTWARTVTSVKVKVKEKDR
jgi:hypothetical protein